MISLLLLILLFIALGAMIVMFVTLGWWFLPIIIIGLLAKAIINAVIKLVRSIKGEEQVVMFKKDLEKNYVLKSSLKKTEANN